MTDASEQLQLSLPRDPVKVDAATIAGIQSMTRAIVLCAELAGLVNSKDQARAIGIDATQWSVIKDGGGKYFPQDKYLTMFEEFGNEVPLMYLLYQRGYDLASLRKRESETERALRVEREAHAETRLKLAVIEDHYRRLK